jgi:SAM-dependent methyltransferase
MMVNFGSVSKEDTSDDDLFYRQPRLVLHIDSGFINSLKEVYRRFLKTDMSVLDLMSSWVSHLPEELKFAKVVGHGMNQVELAANPRLDEFFVQNLNKDAKLPAADTTFDAVLNTVSIQYLENATAVLKEAHRVLKPGGVAIISFSNRMFPTKAVSLWTEREEEQRPELVRQYLIAAGFQEIEIVQRQSSALGWLFQQGDPFYCLIARKT